MSRSLTVPAVDDGSPGVPDCADYWLCQKLYDRFGPDWLAENARVLVATPARIVHVVVRVAVVRALAHRAIRRLTDRTATGAVPTMGIRTPLPLLAGSSVIATGVR